jgi:hypothetical protein
MFLSEPLPRLLKQNVLEVTTMVMCWATVAIGIFASVLGALGLFAGANSRVRIVTTGGTFVGSAGVIIVIMGIVGIGC